VHFILQYVHLHVLTVYLPKITTWVKVYSWGGSGLVPTVVIIISTMYMGNSTVK